MLKGKWGVRELNIREFIGQVKGKRFRHDELKRIFLKWIGEEEESIIHIRDDKDAKDSPMSILKECLARYGVQGEEIFRAIAVDSAGDYGMNSVNSMNVESEIDEALKKDSCRQAIDNLRLSSYSTDELFAFLSREKIGVIRTKLRSELFHRFWGRIIPPAAIESTQDEPARELLRIISAFAEKDRYSGIEIFTKVIAPLTCVLMNLNRKTMGEGMGEKTGEEIIDAKEIDILHQHLDDLVKGYERSPDRFTGAKDIAYIRERVKGVVVVLDGLRYDLWLFLKEVMVKEGWRMKEAPLVVPPPTSTFNFRRLLGIDEEADEDVGQGRAAILKWAEHNAGSRELKRFLKGNEEIKVLHFNFIDAKIHNTTLDLYPLYQIIKNEFINGIVPILKKLPPFILLSDHGFVDTKRMKDRYAHGGNSVWETVAVVVEVG